jgi:hypothetical protein
MDHKIRIPDHEVLKGVEKKAYSLIKTLPFREAFAHMTSLSFHRPMPEYLETETTRKL